MGFLEQFKEQTAEITRKFGLSGYLVYLGLIVALVLVWQGWFDEHVTMFVGVLIPSHFSLKAIASEDKDDDKQWLTYWTVFSLFVVAELFVGFAIREIIPFYYVIKLGFLIWLFLPNFQGASWIYDKILFRFFKSVEKDVDRAINKVSGKKSS